MKILNHSILVTLTLAVAEVGMGQSFHEPVLVCKDGRAFVEAVTLDTGCNYPPKPYYEKLLLESSGVEGGTIDLTLGETFPQRDPDCDNPRGMPHFHLLPLPIEQGEWDIFLEGKKLGTVSFRSVLPCRIKTEP